MDRNLDPSPTVSEALRLVYEDPGWSPLLDSWPSGADTPPTEHPPRQLADVAPPTALVLENAVSVTPLSSFPLPTDTIVSPLERSYLKNSKGCEFEISLQATVEMYTSQEIAKQKLVLEQLKERSEGLEKEPFVMELSGDVVSRR